MQRTNNRILSVIAALALLLCCGPFSMVATAETIPGKTPITVTAEWKTGEEPTGSITVDIYKEGDSATSLGTVTLKASKDWTDTIEIEKLDDDTKYIAVWNDADTLGYSSESIPSAGRKPDEVKGGLFWKGSSLKHPYGELENFNVIAFGNFKANNADVEGGLAVKGNLDASGSGYTVGIPDDAGKYSPSTGGIGRAIAPHQQRLIVGGSVLMYDAIYVYGGHVYLKDNIL